MKRIEEEHPEILAHVDRLIDQSQRWEPSPEHQLAMRKAFDRLYLRLRAHERAENQLFAQGFGANLGGVEYDQPGLNPHLLFSRDGGELGDRIPNAL
jgi:hypothetical protein